MKRWKWCLAGLAVVSLIGFQGLVPAAWGAESIKIGLPLPLTGIHAKFGEAIRNAYLMALEEINAQGGIRKGPYKGRTIEFLIEDTQSKPDVAKAAVEKLITRDKVPMIVGEYSSSNVYAVAGTINNYQIPYLTQTGAADNVTQQGWKWVFRINPPASEYAGALQEFLFQVVKPKSMAIIFENTLFGTSTSKAMKEWADQQKVEITNFEPYEAGGIDFKPLLLKVKAKNPDVVYMVSYLLDALQLMKQSREVGLAPKLFAGGAAGFTMPEFVQGAGAAAENLVSATLWAPDVKYPGTKEFYEKYNQKYKVHPEYHSTEGYAAAYVLRDVLERTVSLKNEDLRKVLSETNLMTPFGPIKFVAYGKHTNQNRLPTLLVQILKGKLVTVWPKEYAAAPYVYPGTKP
ncbi:MAG: ABC transporter substrate-binding protein [Candidatus Tectomicrobia bacterium]|uniref:ABC transporter substrate-binding protein n=1 Tax=Tectimicrobiota bacterium TaxID=2528274 RepID=A0A932M0X2_UNCTE|nr:ABC transporter substrate-binding protein [Candidatus Tectomicrobia bacterium]